MWDLIASSAIGQVANRNALPYALPAAIFWATGTVSIFGRDDDTWWRTGLASLLPSSVPFTDFTPPEPQAILALDTLEQVLLIASALLTIGASGLFLRWAALSVLRMCEGYWPRGLGWLVKKRTQVQEAKRRKKSEQLAALSKGLQGNMLSPEQFWEYATLDEDLALKIPRNNLLPTRFGNLLKAAEQAPRQRYGLDAFLCWPRLWLIAPDSTKVTISRARGNLNSAAACLLTSVLLMIWSLAIWWLVLVALLAAVLSYRSMVGFAVTYGELFVATFDVHRWDLYQALHWPLPRDASDEQSSGLHLTQFLLHGWEEDDAFLPLFDGPHHADTVSPPPESLTACVIRSVRNSLKIRSWRK